jgi:hypothetical protein
MAEKLLNLINGMPKQMWVDSFGNSGCPCMLFDNALHASYRIRVSSPLVRRPNVTAIDATVIGPFGGWGDQRSRRRSTILRARVALPENESPHNRYNVFVLSVYCSPNNHKLSNGPRGIQAKTPACSACEVQ